MGFKAMIKCTIILSCIFYWTITVIFLHRNQENNDFSELNNINMVSNSEEVVETHSNVEVDVGSTQYRGMLQPFRTTMNGKNMESERREPITTKNATRFVNRLPKKRQILAKMWDNYYKLQRKTEPIMLYHGNSNSENEAHTFFQAVSEDIYVFSVFYDNRQMNDDNTSVVRILALSRLQTKDNLLCKFSKSRADQWIVANRQDMSDNHEKLYGGVMYICNIPRNFSNLNQPPTEVYIKNVFAPGGNNSNSTSVTEKCVTLQVIRNKLSFLKEDIHQVHELDNTRNNSWQNIPGQTDVTSQYKNKHKNNTVNNKIWKINYQGRQPMNNLVSDKTELPVLDNNYQGRKLVNTSHSPELESENKYKIAMCVPPIFGKVRISEFIQFIEIHKILGVSHFIFYPMNVSHDIIHLLNYYKHEGSATTIDWVLPSVVNDSSQIWYNGQIIAMQDCLYRTMGVYDLTAFLDLDEILVPRKTNDWHSMFQHFDKYAMETFNESHPSYIFKSGFFETPPNNVAMATDYRTTIQKLSFLNQIYRNEQLSNVRTKIVVKPDRIEQVGIHHVSKLLNSKSKMADIPDDSALIHHYRKCSSVSDDQMHCGKKVEDSAILKYADILSKRYHSTLDKNVKYFKRITSM